MTLEVPKSSNAVIIVSDVVNYLDKVMQLQEHVMAQSGLVVGDKDAAIKGILICLDVTEAVLEEAMEKNCNLLIANQSFLLDPLGRITSESYAGKCVIKAIKHEIAIYVLSTNLDHLGNGASHRIAHLIELQEIKPIVSKQLTLYKLTTTAPVYAEAYLVQILHQAGAVPVVPGWSNYVRSLPVKLHYAREPHDLSFFYQKSRTEMAQEVELTFMVSMDGREKVIQTLLHNHPYEKVSYYLDQIETIADNVGSGVVGILPVPLPAKYFLKYAKTKLALSYLQHTHHLDRLIKTVAIYAGDGNWLLEQVLYKCIDAFITTGLGYVQFLEACEKLLMIDIGYYPTRMGIKKLILALLSKKFNNITILRCKTNTNPIHHIND